jgi:hypothetical protein
MMAGAGRQPGTRKRTAWTARAMFGQSHVQHPPLMSIRGLVPPLSPETRPPQITLRG